ncbi:MAG: hypothetical protein Q7U34_01625, partial [Anaerolineales bacterium]|nr:hypothetical protein [Anaerolineales bacterium]
LWRRGSCAWVKVNAPGTWFLAEIRNSLRGLPIPVVVTTAVTPFVPRTPAARRCETATNASLPGLPGGAGSKLQITDFSFRPRTFSSPSPPPPAADDLPKGTNELPERELACLRVLARLETAFTSEIASLAGMSIPYARQALVALRKQRLAYYESGDYPFWKLSRPGLSLALRSWNVPASMKFSFYKERARSQGRHRRDARLWPAWLRRAWPHAEIWSAWSEVSIPGRLFPDALAWGRLDNQETLFWLEVESGKASRADLQLKMTQRLSRAAVYANQFSFCLVFAVLAPPWVRETVAQVFHDLPQSISVVLTDWKDFGRLPTPKWGAARW